ncbi:MAG: HD domain-containing protein [Flavobacteriia bacterium]|nr:HD domain-containing protein [Flavobacteriia bacterium]
MFPFKQLKGNLLFTFCFLSFLDFAQSEISFTNFRITDGLSQSSVTAIIEDNQHQIWFGTQEGLNRFDGVNFTVFQKYQEKGIEDAYVFSACKDVAGNLWFGTKSGLLSFHAKNEIFHTYFPNKNRRWTFIQTEVLNDKELLLLTDDHETYVFNVYTKKFSVWNHPNFVVKTITPATKGLMLLGENNQVLWLTSPSSSTEIVSASEVPVNGIFYVKGTLYVFSAQGTYSVNPKTRQKIKVFTQFKDLEKISVMGLQEINGLWLIATAQNGLFTINSKGKVQNYTSDIFQSQSLSSNLLSVLYKDKSNVFWVGSDRGVSSFIDQQIGLTKIGPSGILDKGLPCENVWSFQSGTSSNQVLIGTDLGVSILDFSTSKLTHHNRAGAKTMSYGGDASVLDILRIKNNSYLLTCYDGIFLFNPNARNPFTPIPIKDPKIKAKHKHFYKVAALKEHYIVATNAGVLFFNFKSKSFSEIRVVGKKAPYGSARDLVKIKGKYWVLMENIGLCQLEFKNETFVLIPHPLNRKIKALTNDPLMCLSVFSPNVMVIGTYGSGLITVDFTTGKCTSITKKDGLPNNVINGIVKDQFGKLWVSTNRGIVCLDIHGKLDAYNEKFGGEVNEFNSNAYYRDAKGRIFFGGIFGFNYFNPKDFSQESLQQYPIISRIKFERKNSRWPKGFILGTELADQANLVELDYNFRNFEIFFQPNSLHLSRNVDYKYVIIGEETDTILLGKSNRISFNSLASGTYYVRIYSRFGGGDWTETPALLTVIINPPLWATVEFWIFMAILLFIAVVIYIRKRIEKTRRENVKLEMKIVQRTKEIREQKYKIELQNEVIKEEKEKVILQQKLLFIEKENAERWLGNALPAQVVKELKVRGKVQAKAYESASIIFTDVVGFTKIAESMTPSRLVNKLDVLFRRFDQIILANNLEKIKTIGDAYMAVGGIPEKNSTHAIDSCIASLQIQDYMKARKYEAIANHKDYWEIRIGINTGPVTAGIIGKLKIAYDVWGSAVNKAQRMEMLAKPGSVAISEHTFKIVEPYFEFESMGKAQMKSKAIIDMYEIKRIKPELSIKGEGLVPNDRFYEIVSLHYFSSIKYYKAENELVHLLETALPNDLFYHTLEHTKEVVKAVERIALLEGVTDEGLFLLKTAALFHDAGFIHQYEHNEPIGAKMAEEMLPKYGFTEQHIKTISELIFATQIPHKPVNKLQEIICDADLDYLGTTHFDVISDNLKKELLGKGKIGSAKEWDEIQVKFLQQHKYFTETSISSRQERKLQNLEKVIARLSENAY